MIGMLGEHELDLRYFDTSLLVLNYFDWEKGWIERDMEMDFQSVL